VEGAESSENLEKEIEEAKAQIVSSISPALLKYHFQVFPNELCYRLHLFYFLLDCPTSDHLLRAIFGTISFIFDP